MTDNPGTWPEKAPASYQVDERVRVTIEGRIAEVRPDNPARNGPEILLDPGDGSEGHLIVPLDWTGLTIDRLTPADGVPKPGQIWADADGNEMFATKGDPRAGGKEIYLTGRDGKPSHWLDVHAYKGGPITLVRDIAPEPAPAEPEAAAERVVKEVPF